MIWLRSALFNAWFFGGTFLLGLFGVGVRAVAPSRALGLARLWARVVLAGARVIAGIEVSITGLERLPPGAALLASQHQSAFDTLIWVTVLPRASYIFKAELARIPLFGPMLVASGQIPLDRKATVAGIRRLLRAAAAAKADGRQIVIFPEGTRVAVGAEVPIRAGFSMIAARTSLPIYPVSTDSGRLWGRRAFRKYPGTVHIHIGEPIAPDLPGPKLVSTLQERWRNAAFILDGVDKSVDFESKALTLEQVKRAVEVKNEPPIQRLSPH